MSKTTRQTGRHRPRRACALDAILDGLASSGDRAVRAWAERLQAGDGKGDDSGTGDGGRDGGKKRGKKRSA